MPTIHATLAGATTAMSRIVGVLATARLSGDAEVAGGIARGGGWRHRDRDAIASGYREADEGAAGDDAGRRREQPALFAARQRFQAQQVTA